MQSNALLLLCYFTTLEVTHISVSAERLMWPVQTRLQQSLHDLITSVLWCANEMWTVLACDIKTLKP